MRLVQTAKYLSALFFPWRPAFVTYADASRLRFYVQPRDVIGRHIAKYGSHERELTAWIDRFLSRAAPGIVVDVGANVGWHTIHAARHAAVEAVVAFEPDAFNAWLLERNLSINGVGKALVVSSAVGASSGTARLNRYKGSNNGKHSIAADHGLSARIVPLTSIDAALAALQLHTARIMLMKIDVEGYEPAVIDGAMEALKRTEAIVTEFSPALSRAGSLSLSAMVDRLTALAFQPNLLTGEHLAEVAASTLKTCEDQVDVVWLKREV